MKRSYLLAFDAVINLALGILLLVFPRTIVEALGVPDPPIRFYPNILGGVLLGIGIALLIEVLKPAKRNTRGLGLFGAVVINICAGIVLALWLIFGELNLSLPGSIFLWILVAILIGLSSLELITQLRD